MTCIWSGDVLQIKDIIRLKALVKSLHHWAMRTLRNRISDYIDLWREVLDPPRPSLSPKQREANRRGSRASIDNGSHQSLDLALRTKDFSLDADQDLSPKQPVTPTRPPAKRGKAGKSPVSRPRSADGRFMKTPADEDRPAIKAPKNESEITDDTHSPSASESSDSEPETPCRSRDGMLSPPEFSKFKISGPGNRRRSNKV
jgi:hypothetical protein